MQFSFTKTPPPPPSLAIGDNILEVVTETKLLGVWIQNNLEWDIHVHEMVSKSSRQLHILSRLKKFGVSKEDLVSVFKFYVRPVLEYAAPV